VENDELKENELNGPLKAQADGKKGYCFLENFLRASMTEVAYSSRVV